MTSPGLNLSHGFVKYIQRNQVDRLKFDLEQTKENNLLDGSAYTESKENNFLEGCVYMEESDSPIRVQKDDSFHTRTLIERGPFVQRTRNPVPSVESNGTDLIFVLEFCTNDEIVIKVDVRETDSAESICEQITDQHPLDDGKKYSLLRRINSELGNYKKTDQRNNGIMNQHMPVMEASSKENQIDSCFEVERESVNHSITQEQGVKNSITQEPGGNNSITQESSVNNATTHEPSVNHDISQEPSIIHDIIQEPSVNCSVAHGSCSNSNNDSSASASDRADTQRPDMEVKVMGWRDSANVIPAIYYSQLHNPLHINANMDALVLGRELAYRLSELKSNTLGHVARVLGVEMTVQIFEETKQVIAKGGLMTDDGLRQRTPGGTFLALVKQGYANAEQMKEIFREDKELKARQDKERKLKIRERKEREDLAKSRAAEKSEEALLNKTPTKLSTGDLPSSVPASPGEIGRCDWIKRRAAATSRDSCGSPVQRVIRQPHGPDANGTNGFVDHPMLRLVVVN